MTRLQWAVMERKGLSRHEVEVFRVLMSEPARWWTHIEIGEAADAVSDRTVRLHTKRLVDAGLIEVIEVFPGYRYRIAQDGRKRNSAYLTRLRRAALALGIDLGTG